MASITLAARATHPRSRPVLGIQWRIMHARIHGSSRGGRASAERRLPLVPLPRRPPRSRAAQRGAAFARLRRKKWNSLRLRAREFAGRVCLSKCYEWSLRAARTEPLLAKHLSIKLCVEKISLVDAGIRLVMARLRIHILVKVVFAICSTFS